MTSRHPFAHRWRRAVAMLAVVLPAAAVQAAVAIGSPAWNDLMARPAADGGLPAFYAADLVATWGRPEEAVVLRRALLQHHLRRAAGDAAPMPATLGEVWQQAQAQPPALEALATLHAQALNHALAATPDPQPLPAERAAEGWRDGGAPGGWRSGGRLALQLVVENRAPLVLAPLGLQRVAGAPGAEIRLPCQPASRVARLEPRQAARWWCEGETGAEGWRAAPQPRWASTALADEGSLREMVSLLGDRAPLDLREFVQRNQGCIRQGTCPAMAAAVASRAEERARQRPSAEARYEAQRRREIEGEQRRRRAKWLPLWVGLAYTFGGLALHLLVARAAGRIVASTVTLAIGPAIAAWMFFTYGIGSGWGALAMLFVLLALCVVGVPLTMAYNFIHKRFFAGL